MLILSFEFVVVLEGSTGGRPLSGHHAQAGPDFTREDQPYTTSLDVTVNDAATHLNTFVQSRIGRDDISDKDLMAQAFSDKPPEEGKARLRCPGNPVNETVRSQQEGARSFSIGVFQAIRNPAHHLTGDWNPSLAFHHLVALSQVAYWFRHWSIDRYRPPPPDLNMVIAATRK